MNTTLTATHIARRQIPGKSPRILLVFLLFLMVTCPPLLHAVTQTDNIRVSVTPKGEVRVGQRVTLTIDLMTTTWFSGSPEFDLPEIPGAIALKVGSFGLNRTETINGTKYSVQGHEFAMFAQRPGEIVIEPFNVRFFPAVPGETKPRSVTLKAPELRVTATMPPGAEKLAALISTTQFKLSETWDPKPDAAKVGDAFTRNITMRAEDVLGMAFPPLETPDIKGFGIYSKDPSVTDNMDRGNFTGERTETITYVCEEAGTVTLPEVVIHWWDMENDELKTETLPSVKLKVTPNPKLFKEAGSFSPRATNNRGVKWMVFIGSVLAACLTALFRARTAILLTIRKWNTDRNESEKTYFNRFKTACHSGNPMDTHNSLMTWLDKFHTGAHPATLEWLVAESENPTLSEQAALLQSGLFKNAGSTSPPWSSNVFFHEVSKTRRQLLKKRARQHDRHSLPDLNPS